jgi:hypothetical protein
MTAPSGAIWYTLDGSDPRVTGGGVNPSAVAYTGTPVDISVGMTVQARVLDGGVWSALNEAAFFTVPPADPTNLRITELHYHPADHPSVPDDEDLEFIELMNISNAPISLAGVQIAEFASMPYTFGNAVVLSAGERIVVARNPSAFDLVYGSGMNVAPSGFSPANFSNGGERVRVVSAVGETIVDFTYTDASPWSAAADGSGPSLEVVDPTASPNNAANWRASFYAGGTPGTDRISLPGDYDRNRTVDAADQSPWRASFGVAVEQGTAADGNGDGVVDAADYVVWRRNMGASLPALATAAALLEPVDAIEPLAALTNEERDLALATLFTATPQKGTTMRTFTPPPRERLASASPTSDSADRIRQLQLELSRVRAIGFLDEATLNETHSSHEDFSQVRAGHTEINDSALNELFRAVSEAG